MIHATGKNKTVHRLYLFCLIRKWAHLPNVAAVDVVIGIYEQVNTHASHGCDQSSSQAEINGPRTAGASRYRKHRTR